MSDDLTRDGARAEAGLGAWILLFGALAASAGQGLFLLARLTRYQWIPNFPYLQKVVGLLGTGVLVWFMLCVPLAAGAFLLRRTLQGKGWLWPLAWVVALVSLGSFAFYGQMMLAAGGR